MVEMNDYNAFAKVYNQYWGSYGTQVYSILEHLVLKKLPHKGAVLDLCCGTGQLAKRLLEGGYDVTGVDISESMIEIAKEQVPQATFVVQGARLTLPAGEFDAVFSTYDSLNHIMTIEELASVFKNVHNVLAKIGYFAFDLNMREGYENRWRGTFSIVEPDLVCVTRSSHDVQSQTGQMGLTIFELVQDEWQRQDLTLTQRWYDEDQILDKLHDAGFTEVRTVSGDEPIVEDGPTTDGRMFFVAQRG